MPAMAIKREPAASSAITLVVVGGADQIDEMSRKTSGHQSTALLVTSRPISQTIRDDFLFFLCRSTPKM
jgi:hypothetical protein